MAYSQKFNPDALPAHMEPDKAAELLANAQSRPPTHNNHHVQRPPPPPKGNSNMPPPRMTPPAGISSHAAPQSYRNRPPPKMDNPASRIYSPPPANYGHGPRPDPSGMNRPSQRPAPSPSPAFSGPPSTGPTSDDPQQLLPLFRAANVSRTGALTEAELGSALVNGDYSSFDPNTVKTMVRMFDRSGDGVIQFEEFLSLWRFLAAWRELFDRFDEDRSGRISLEEFENALVAFGYRLSRMFVRVLFTTYEAKGRRRAHLVAATAAPFHPGGRGHGMSFDLFVQACISLKRMTDVFKRYDDDRDGYVTLSFEEFLTEVLGLQD